MTEPHTLSVEIEVPGTPEQVWDAIATGHGITAWFAPAEVEEREGGRLAFDMGDGMEESGVVTAWDRPGRFAYEEDWPAADGSPPGKLASEWLVETRAGGTCVVRIVSSLFATGAGWEDELESMRYGWESYLQNLRLYLTHFAGRRCSWLGVRRPAAGSPEQAMVGLLDGLGLADAAEGERARVAPGAPPLGGVVERISGDERHRELWLLTDEPASGMACVFAYAWRDEVYAAVQAYLFGDDAPAAVARDRPAWEAWMDARFAPAARGAAG
jgi:uncharacterized protein YndB with AHSA1/START domain